jgi:hypothetical protein
MAVIEGRKPLEVRAIRLALESYLSAAGWTGITYSEGYDNTATIKNNQINIIMMDSGPEELQIGRVDGGERLFNRIIQIDAYMKSEKQADAISDTIIDFIDLVPVAIIDSNSTALGSIICQDTDSIQSRNMPPILTNPTLLRWRNISRANYEAFYPNG